MSNIKIACLFFLWLMAVLFNVAAFFADGDVARNHRTNSCIFISSAIIILSTT